MLSQQIINIANPMLNSFKTLADQKKLIIDKLPDDVAEDFEKLMRVHSNLSKLIIDSADSIINIVDESEKDPFLNHAIEAKKKY